MELVQDLLRPFVEDLGRVREELGAERFRREQAERERDELAARLQALAETREEPHGLETATEGEAGTSAPPERETSSSQGAAPERASWWRRVFGFE